MKYILLLIFTLTSLFATQNNEILLLHSYNKGLKWSDGISEGLLDVVSKYPQYELTTEYMDSKKINSKEYFESLVNLYKQKFATRKYKAVVVADNYAYEFVLKNHKTLFSEVPIVFCGVENYNSTNTPMVLQPYVTGVIEYKDIRKNLKLINKLIPSLDTLYIISDNSFSSLAIKDQILSNAKEFDKKFKIIYDNDIDIYNLEKKVSNLPKHSAVLFTSLYNDKYGRYIPYNKLRIFFSNSKYPVFALNKIHLGEGVIGGVMINPYEQGHLAGKKIFEIIKGKNPLQVEISKPLPNTYFDQNVLDKFGIKKDDLPMGITVINKPKDFFEKNRKLIDSLFLMTPLLVILIVFLIINIYRRISLEIQLVEQNRLDSVLLNNIQSAILWKSNDDILLGCNNALCKILNVSKEDIIGKHIKDIMPELCKVIDTHANFVDELETRLYTTASTPIDVLIRRKKYLNNKNALAGVVTLISDITKTKKLENQRKKDEQFIIQRSKLSEVGEMITSIAHQWKTPLVEISAIAQELQYKRKKTQISKEDTDLFVDDIMTQVSYMTNTVDDFRNFIKPSAKKSEFSVNIAIGDILHIIEHSIKYNYIEIDTFYEDSQKDIIYGYPNEFKQSILNIINNAKDSIIAKREKESFDGKISLHVESCEELVCISIKDNGIGIQEKNLSTIFDPFNSTKKDGDGFGLYMAKLIIEDKMQGSIKALKCDNGAEILICVKNTNKKLSKIST